MTIVERMKASKCTGQITVRLQEDLERLLDEYIERREREIGVPMSRALATRELLWRQLDPEALRVRYESIMGRRPRRDAPEHPAQTRLPDF